MNHVHTSTAPPQAALTVSHIGAPHTIWFPAGLPGFEACRSFVLMAPEGDGPLQYLKAVDGPAASFLVIDPRRVDPNYGCALSDTDRHHLGLTDDATLLWLSLVSVEGDGTITVNMRAPVVINPARMVGRQIIPHDSRHSVRHVLAKGQ